MTTWLLIRMFLHQWWDEHYGPTFVKTCALMAVVLSLVSAEEYKHLIFSLLAVSGTCLALWSINAFSILYAINNLEDDPQ